MARVFKIVSHTPEEVGKAREIWAAHKGTCKDTEDLKAFSAAEQILAESLGIILIEYEPTVIDEAGIAEAVHRTIPQHDAIHILHRNPVVLGINPEAPKSPDFWLLLGEQPPQLPTREIPTRVCPKCCRQVPWLTTILPCPDCGTQLIRIETEAGFFWTPYESRNWPPHVRIWGHGIIPTAGSHQTGWSSDGLYLYRLEREVSGGYPGDHRKDILRAMGYEPYKGSDFIWVKIPGRER